MSLTGLEDQGLNTVRTKFSLVDCPPNKDCAFLQLRWLTKFSLYNKLLHLISNEERKSLSS